MRVVKPLVLCTVFTALPSQGESLPLNRRLIINGSPQPVDDFPYVVSLMICSLRTDGRAKGGSCRHFCTGSLIAPDVVLTAGHCVLDDSTPWGIQKPLTDLRRIRVLLGATYTQDRTSETKLVKVRDFANAGYNQNLHFPMDNDVGLFFLDQCLSPKKWPTVQVSTPARSLDEGCTKARLIGWGKHKAVPDLLYTSNGLLHSYIDKIQPYAVCRQWYVDIHSKDVPRGLRQAIPMKELHDTLSPDRHLCHGGDSESSTCFGDSGGPLLVTDPESGKDVVVGVTSFGVGKTCGGGASVVARVSTYAPWIEGMIRGKSLCHKYDVSSTFLTYPLEERRQSATDRTGRCGTGKWQCIYSGACIDAREVCNGYANCDDGSDEEADVCMGELSASNVENLPPPIEIVAAIMGLEMVEADDESGMDDVSMDEDGAPLDETEAMEVASSVDESDFDEDFGIEDILPEGVYLNTREMTKWRERYEDVLIHYANCPAAFALMEHITTAQCVRQYSKLKDSLKRVGTNPRAVPRYLLDACDAFDTCIGEPAPRLLVAWIKHCNKAPLGRQRPPAWIYDELRPELKFCLEARPFAEDESRRSVNALEFKSKFGKFCPS
jgi:secreted trypsin-like serine protease